jgi:replicative DNA helicase
MTTADFYPAYLEASRVLTCRMVAEPQGLHRIVDWITPAMFPTDNKVAPACFKLYRELGEYSVLSVAKEAGLKPKEVQEAIGKYPTEDLALAAEYFARVYSQYLELQISECVPTWAARNMSAEEMRGEADRIRKERGINRLPDIDDGVGEFETELHASVNGEEFSYRVKTPLHSLTEHIPDHEPGEYVIIAGRSGMGKTFMALNYAQYNANIGVPGCYINLENKSKNVWKRLWQLRTGQKFRRNLSGLPDARKDELLYGWEATKKLPLRVHNGPATSEWVTAVIRQERYERGIEYAVIDYVGLMKKLGATGGGNRAYEIADISREVKAMALELGIVVFVLVQINREVEKQGDKRPAISDLRASGALEQDADTVLLLYRPEYYAIKKDKDNNYYPAKYAEIIIGKGRECGPGRIKCRFDEVFGYHDPEEEVPTMPTQKPVQVNGHAPSEQLPF